MKSNAFIETLRETTEAIAGILEQKDQKIKELQDEIDASEDEDDELTESIDTGIGTIHYRVEGSIDQQELMEALADIIARDGVRGLMNHLREVYAV